MLSGSLQTGVGEILDPFEGLIGRFAAIQQQQRKKNELLIETQNCFIA
jgi:hypothetical protein